jgi:hypothetical protein
MLSMEQTAYIDTSFWNTTRTMLSGAKTRAMATARESQTLATASGRMSSREKLLESVASNNKMTPVAYDQMLPFEVGQILSYPRTRSPYQFSKILMSRRYR